MMRFSTPPVVKNLIIINLLFFSAQTLLPGGYGERLTQLLGLHYWGSAQFNPYQLVTHLFLHGDIMHLFTNMFALWMFGRILEYDLGSRRFLIYYMVTGIGAALLHSSVVAWEMAGVKEQVSAYIAQSTNAMEIAQLKSLLAQRLDVVTLGASGAVFGILLSFGMLHPNDRILLLIPPIPMKAKYFVIAYGVLELMLGLTGTASNIAHFAHIGGMIFGFLLLYYWKKTGKIYY